jgi:hypothetical protein
MFVTFPREKSSIHPAFAILIANIDTITKLAEGQRLAEAKPARVNSFLGLGVHPLSVCLILSYVVHQGRTRNG